MGSGGSTPREIGREISKASGAAAARGGVSETDARGAKIRHPGAGGTPSREPAQDSRTGRSGEPSMQQTAPPPSLEAWHAIAHAAASARSAGATAPATGIAATNSANAQKRRTPGFYPGVLAPAGFKEL